MRAQLLPVLLILGTFVLKTQPLYLKYKLNQAEQLHKGGPGKRPKLPACSQCHSICVNKPSDGYGSSFWVFQLNPDVVEQRRALPTLLCPNF